GRESYLLAVAKAASCWARVASDTRHHRERADGRARGANKVQRYEDEGELADARVRELLQIERFDDVDPALHQEHAVGRQHRVPGTGGKPLESDRVGARRENTAIGEPVGPRLADSGDTSRDAEVGLSAVGEPP